MEQIMNRGLALGAAAALVGAGLIATNPTAPAIPLPAPSVQHIDVQLTTDVFSALATNVDNVFTASWGVLTSLTELHLSAAATDLSVSIENVVNMPENLIAGGIAALTGESNPDFFDITANPFFSSNILGTLGETLNAMWNNVANLLHDLASFQLANAYIAASEFFNLAVFTIPGEFIIGPLMALGL